MTIELNVLGREVVNVNSCITFLIYEWRLKLLSFPKYLQYDFLNSIVFHNEVIWVNLMMENSLSTIWRPILYTDVILHKHKKPSNHLNDGFRFWMKQCSISYSISSRSSCNGFVKYLVHFSEVNSILQDCAKPILV